MIHSLLGVVHSVKGCLVHKFRRRLYLHSTRLSDIFIVSYPRSGTTWFSFILANLFKSNPNEEIHSPKEYVPDINKAYFSHDTLKPWSHMPDPRFFRMHAPYDPALAKIIYILRDPRDVIVSYYHFKCLTDNSFQLSMADFIARDDHWPCRWDEHVAGWVTRRCHPRLLLVRYEAMHKDTVEVLKAVLNFVNLTYAETDIIRAVQASHFDKMWDLETKYRMMTGSAVMNQERWIRRGKIGGWQDELDRESVQIIESKYGKIMREVGYG